MKKGILTGMLALLIQAQAWGQVKTIKPKEAGNILQSLGSVNAKAKLQCTTPEGLQYICEDMTKLACKPGSFNDGTGTSYSEEQVNERMEALQKKARAAYVINMKQIFLNPDAKFNQVRTLALAATSQNGTPDCESKTPDAKIRCFNQVSTILANKLASGDFRVRVDGPVGRSSPELDFASFEALRSNLAFSRAIKSTRDEAFKSVVQNDLSKKIETEIFPNVKKLLVAKVKKTVKDPKVQKMMIDKLENITFNGNACGALTGSAGSEPGGMETLLVSNAYYSSASQEFRYCNGYLIQSDSEFMIARIIGHELAHSIDPCNIALPLGVGFDYTDASNVEACEKEYPVPNLVQCLRSRESVGASRMEWGRDEGRNKEINMVEPTDGFYESRAKRKTKPKFCDGDQIGESVADWFGNEILPEYIATYHKGLSQAQKITGYSNVYRSDCHTRFSKTRHYSNEHPDTEDRIDRIMMANEAIRTDLGCLPPKNDVHYCKPGEEFIGHPIRADIEAEAEALRKQNQNQNQNQQGSLEDYIKKGGGVGGMGGMGTPGPVVGVPGPAGAPPPVSIPDPGHPGSGGSL